MASVALFAAVDADGTTALVVLNGEVVTPHIETTGPAPRASTGLVERTGWQWPCDQVDRQLGRVAGSDTAQAVIQVTPGCRKSLQFSDNSTWQAANQLKLQGYKHLGRISACWVIGYAGGIKKVKNT